GHPHRTRFQRTDVEFEIEIGFGEAVGLEVEIGDVRGLDALQWIEIGVVHPERTELADEPQDEHLLVHRRRVDHRTGEFLVLRELDERFDDRRMRDVGRAAAELVEIAPPFAVDARRIGEIALVELLDERRIAAEQRAAGEKLGHASHQVTSSAYTTYVYWGAFAPPGRPKARIGPPPGGSEPAFLRAWGSTSSASRSAEPRAEPSR